MSSSNVNGSLVSMSMERSMGRMFSSFVTLKIESVRLRLLTRFLRGLDDELGDYASTEG